MKKVIHTTAVLAGSLLLSLSAGVLRGQPARTGLDLGDASLFPPEFFPSLAEVSEQELLLAGLQSLFPRQIVTQAPDLKLPESAPPVVRDLEGKGVYIRVKDLPSALSAIEENLSRPVVVLDLRFLAADLESTLTLGTYLTRKSTLTLARAGNYPVADQELNGSQLTIEGRRLRRANQTVFTLSNHETRGPLEALLAQLKLDGEIISIGTASAGATAVFEPFPGLDAYYLISGEVRPANKDSLVETGFVPQVKIAVSETDDRIGYDSLREGVSLDDLTQARESKPRIDEARLLRQRSPSPSRTEPANNEEQVDVPQDPILRGALTIVKALEALGKIGN